MSTGWQRNIGTSDYKARCPIIRGVYSDSGSYPSVFSGLGVPSEYLICLSCRSNYNTYDNSRDHFFSLQTKMWSCDLWPQLFYFILDITLHQLSDGTPKPERWMGRSLGSESKIFKVVVCASSVWFDNILFNLYYTVYMVNLQQLLLSLLPVIGFVAKWQNQRWGTRVCARLKVIEFRKNWSHVACTSDIFGWNLSTKNVNIYCSWYTLICMELL